jgi:hypothetical protein
MMTLGPAALAKEAPGFSLVHAFSGKFKTSIVRSDDGVMLKMVAFVSKALFFVTV